MKTKLLKRLRKKSKDNVRLSRDRLTGEYIVYERLYHVWEDVHILKEMFRTKDRKAAEDSCRALRRNYILEQLGRKPINI